MIKFSKNLPKGAGLDLVNDFTVRKVSMTSFASSFLFLEVLISKLEKENHPMIVSAKNFQNRGYIGGRYEYSYDMKRLGLISKDEKELISAVTNYYWYHHRSLQNIEEDKFIHKLMKQYPNLASFMIALYDWGKYDDIHDENIMMDEDESYKLIDLEGFNLREPNWLYDDWGLQKFDLDSK